jgi:hypothetical protein
MTVPALFRAVLALALVLTALVATPTSLNAHASQDRLWVVGTESNSLMGTGWLSVPVPEAAEPGDLLVAVYSVHDRKDVRGPEGWALAHVEHYARQLTQTVWTKIAAESDLDSYAWNGNDRRTSSGAIIAIRGADTDVSLGASSSGHSNQAREIVAPSVTPHPEESLLLGLWSANASGGISGPGSMETIASLDEGMSLTVAAENGLVAHSPSGTRTATRTMSSGAIGQLLIVNGAPAPVTEEPPVEKPPVEEPDPDPHLPHENELPGYWSEPATWPGGRVPQAQDQVVIDRHVVVDGTFQADEVEVSPTGVLEFAPGLDATLEVTGNVVVEGTLRMHPNSTGVESVLRFIDVDEEAFVGGGHRVLDSDVGLWFVGDGQADIAGSERLSWTRAAASIGKGATAIQLEDAPQGWQVGDELIITPTSAPGTQGFSNGYSGGTITAIAGQTVTLDAPASFDHPRVDGRWGAEVMNMTRNARIEGTAGGRSHMLFMHTSKPQTLRNLELRHMGPRQETEATYRSSGTDVPITEGVLGRYPMHFHHSFDGAQGSVVENVVARDSGHKAFVAHASNGVTFRGTIAHDVMDTPYWWDRRDTSGGLGHKAVWDPPSNQITYERAIASLVMSDPPFRGYRLSGFELGHGNDLTVTDSVAVGVQGNLHSAGFKWPEGVAAESGDPTIGDHWAFQNNISHNNKVNGIFTWQNTNDPRHIVEQSVVYHNGDHGIIHGAYSNRYTYDRLMLYGNGRSGFDLHAQGAMPLTNLEIDGAEISRYGFTTGAHRGDGSGAVLEGAIITRYRDYGIALLSAEREQLDIIAPRFDGPEASWFYLADRVPENSIIRVQLVTGTAFRLHPASSSQGAAVPEWNARREAIAPFA